MEILEYWRAQRSLGPLPRRGGGTANRPLMARIEKEEKDMDYQKEYRKWLDSGVLTAAEQAELEAIAA